MLSSLNCLLKRLQHQISELYHKYTGITICTLRLSPVHWNYHLYTGITICTLGLPSVHWDYHLYTGITICTLGLSSVHWDYHMYTGITLLIKRNYKVVECTSTHIHTALHTDTAKQIIGSGNRPTAIQYIRYDTQMHILIMQPMHTAQLREYGCAWY